MIKDPRRYQTYLHVKQPDVDLDKKTFFFFFFFFECVDETREAETLVIPELSDISGSLTGQYGILQIE